MEPLKRRVADVLESRPVVFTIIAVIIFSVASLMLETVEGLGPKLHDKLLRN